MSVRGLIGSAVVIVGGTCLLAQQADPRFEVASVKANLAGGPVQFRPNPPDGVNYGNFPLSPLLELAYDLHSFQMVGIPQWATMERFDIVAKASQPIDQAERRAMLRTLLRERFGLRVHIEPHEQTVYVMTATSRDKRPGPALKPRPECAGDSCSAGGTLIRGGLTFTAGTMADIAAMMSLVREQVVIDETGFEGRYDVTLSFEPEQLDASAPAPANARPGFNAAVEDQLGVKLTQQRRPVEMLVIDRLEHPTPD